MVFVRSPNQYVKDFKSQVTAQEDDNMQACTSKKAFVIVILVCWLFGPVLAQNINISDKDKELAGVFK